MKNQVNSLLILLIVGIWNTPLSYAQSDLVTYVGGSGRETFYDVMQITDGTFLVCGYAEDLQWITSGTPQFVLGYTGTIPNALGSNRFGIILHLASDLQSVINVVHFPQGAVEDIRFMKTNTKPYSATGDLYISCNTADSDANNGGYIIAKLDHNFIDGIPTTLSWFKPVWAKSVAKENHPWDVTSQGKVFYISGEAYAYDWSAIYCLDRQGERTVVNGWRTHWLKNGSEWRGTPATSYPLGGIDSVNFSGIVLKSWGRCDLRSWTSAEYNGFYPDGNGGSRKGKWPLDVLFDGPCDPAIPTANGPGYTGYSSSATPVYGGQSLVVDRRSDDVYIGMNFKSVLPGGLPDFEPAVIAMDSSGLLRWWSRLYHEITPQGDTVNSTPDQYIDALAIDYRNNRLVVGARCHGNNVENFWEGDGVYYNPLANGFQNRFTGNNGNIHISWLGKLRLGDGALTQSTYMAELAEGTGALGTPLADPNLDGWPNPNSGWPDVNTTRMSRNAIKVTSSGNVCVSGVGRRTITTSNAYQKMVKPYYGGLSAWNSFVRVYDSLLSAPIYSGLVVGAWDTLTQNGGGNTEIFGMYKTRKGIIAVGRQTADTLGVALGNPIPVNQVPSWGTAVPQNESAILVYYQASNLYDEGDSLLATGLSLAGATATSAVELVFPNPSSGRIHIRFTTDRWENEMWNYEVMDLSGRSRVSGSLLHNEADIEGLESGTYVLGLYTKDINIHKRISVIKH